MIMITGHLKLLTLPVTAVLSAARCLCPPHRTVFQLLRTMASTSPESWQPPRKVRKKEPLRLVKTRESRSRRTELNGPSTVYLQVLGAGTRDNPASIYVFSEFNR